MNLLKEVFIKEGSGRPISTGIHVVSYEKAKFIARAKGYSAIGSVKEKSWGYIVPCKDEDSI